MIFRVLILTILGISMPKNLQGGLVGYAEPPPIICNYSAAEISFQSRAVGSIGNLPLLGLGHNVFYVQGIVNCNSNQVASCIGYGRLSFQYRGNVVGEFPFAFPAVFYDFGTTTPTNYGGTVPGGGSMPTSIYGMYGFWSTSGLSSVQPINIADINSALIYNSNRVTQFLTYGLNPGTFAGIVIRPFIFDGKIDNVIVLMDYFLFDRGFMYLGCLESQRSNDQIEINSL